MLRTSQPTRGFTLVEMLVVITIIAILAGMMLAALGGAAESAKVQRAQQQIAKIDQLINEKWNSYRYRKVPIRITGTDPYLAARARLDGIRELMRMEMPDRMDDILDDPAPKTATHPFPLTARPSLSWAYSRKVVAALGAPPYNTVNEQAECLYLILEQMRDGDRSALNFFMSSEIGDTDGDGLYEILDPWGTPIRFFRWAPGYSVGSPDWSAPPFDQVPANMHPQYSPVTTQVFDIEKYPDPFDPLKVDYRWDPSVTIGMKPFALRPLIVSAGPDKGFDLQNGYYNDDGSSAFRYQTTSPPNDPYHIHYATSGPYSGKPLAWIGACHDVDGDGVLSYGDNITNHGLGLQGE